MKWHLDEAQAGIKISRRSINYLRHADDTTLMAESKEELRLLVRVKEESERTFLKFNMKKVTNLASGTINVRANITGKSERTDSFYFLGLQNHCRRWLQPWNEKMLILWMEGYDKPRQHIKKSETSLCWQRSIQSKLLFFQESCIDMRVIP